MEIAEHFGRGWPRTNGDEDNVCQIQGTGSGRGMLDDSNGDGYGFGKGNGKDAFWLGNNGSLRGIGHGVPHPVKV